MTKSKWRDYLNGIYGKEVEKEIRKKYKDAKFTVSQIAADNSINCIDHLALSTKIGVLSAVISQLMIDKKVKRIGRNYSLIHKGSSK